MLSSARSSARDADVPAGRAARDLVVELVEDHAGLRHAIRRERERLRTSRFTQYPGTERFSYSHILRTQYQRGPGSEYPLSTR